MQSQRLPAEMDKDSRAGSQGVTRGASRGAGSPQAKAGPDSPGGGGRAADVAGSEVVVLARRPGVGGLSITGRAASRGLLLGEVPGLPVDASGCCVRPRGFEFLQPLLLVSPHKLERSNS